MQTRITKSGAYKIANTADQAMSFLTACVSQLGVCFPQQRLQTLDLLVSKSAATMPFISTKDKASQIV